MSQTFEKQVALITGGSTGIGAAAALQLAKAGAKVVITGRNEATLRASAAQHENIHYVVADISTAAGASRGVEEVKKRFGTLDILINNAGIAEIAPLGDASSEHVHRIWSTNVDGLIETTRLALPLLKQSKGVIVNIASIVADQPFPNMSVYCASKAAVLALTRSWAQELAADGIRVNAVSPGPIETPIYDAAKMRVSGEQIDQLGASIMGLLPIKRFGKSEEVSEVIAFLASRASSFVTGAQYSVGGGIEA
jgi:NAD(P)-dependent dehydrogenase (short-subunit alcohol dehydrogenase family)